MSLSGLRRRAGDGAGFTLLELIIVVAIVGILAAAALPLARWTVKRNREAQLQQNLRILRNAIDRYHDAASAGVIEMPEGSTGYPATLEALVEGVPMLQPLPSAVPPVSDEYGASGPGLTGGIAGLMQTEQAAVGAIEADDSDDRSGSETRMPGLTLGNRTAAIGSRPTALPGTRAFAGARQGRGGVQGGGLTGLHGADTGQATVTQPLLGPDGQPLRLVFLRRIPVDPFTGTADWGTRCYGERPDDRLWCGKDVFDVFSKSVAKAIDGSSYRDW